jgi:hypothetical protein
MGYKDMQWTELAQDYVKWRTLVNYIDPSC